MDCISYDKNIIKVVKIFIIKQVMLAYVSVVTLYYFHFKYIKKYVVAKHIKNNWFVMFVEYLEIILKIFIKRMWSWTTKNNMKILTCDV